MSLLEKVGATAAPALATALFLFGHVAVTEAGVLPPGSTVAGKTIGAWTADWWTWAINQPAAANATNDTTGARANINQSGPVFFVAGQPGNTIDPLPENSKVTRAFTVPKDKYLLVPLVNGFYSTNIDGADYEQQLNDSLGKIDKLFAEIDGVPVPGLTGHLEFSPTFGFTVDADNAFGLAAGDTGPGKAGGYFLMLEPLGTSTINIYYGGGLSIPDANPPFFFVTAVDATITGVPEPGSLALLLAGLVPGAWWLRRMA